MKKSVNFAVNYGIMDKGTTRQGILRAEGVWHTIDGRKLSGKPSKAGLYIVGNKKVVIK